MTHTHDTQWPRWEVFKQDAPDRPHQAVGSVHAPDATTALLEARNVFVRRPKAVSLWVVPAEAILSVTRAELAEGGDSAESPPPDAPEQTFHVFRKTSQRRAMTFVDYEGSVDAPTAAVALARARARWSDDTTWVWWIVPAAACVRSDDDDIESWFLPALDKTYRQQSAYGFVNPRRKPPRAGDDTG